MKKMILLMLIFVLFVGCTQNESENINTEKNDSQNITEIKNETINNTEYTKQLEEIESDAVECYYEDENEKMLTKLLGENLRIHYITQYENTEMIFKSDEELWYIKSDKNSQFSSLGLDEDCVWIMWDMKEISSNMNNDDNTNVAPSIFNLQKPTKDKMYCKEGDFGIEMFTPSEKICDMTELIIKMYTPNQ